jgi:small subunit ribosomal protein S20
MVVFWGNKSSSLAPRLPLALPFGQSQGEKVMLELQGAKKCYISKSSILSVWYRKRVELRVTVANIKSAIKRVQVAERNRLNNKAYKSAVKTLMKNYFTSVEKYAANPNPEAMQEVHSRLSDAYSKIDKAVKRKVLHRNNGANKKARLAKALKTIAVASSAE